MVTIPATTELDTTELDAVLLDMQNQITDLAARVEQLENAQPPELSPREKVLKLLTDISGTHTLSGQHACGYLRYIEHDWTEAIENLYDATDFYPAIVAVDYGHGATLDEMLEANKYLVEHWQQGGLVSISFHARNPWTGGSSWDLDARNLIELLNPTTEFSRAARGRWFEAMNLAATGLQDLHGSGVPVLWRPLHEMTYPANFWWDYGAHPGNPEPYKDVWREMHDFFDVKGLDNLLWVYAAANQDEWRAADMFYPGDDWVDVVGIDVYSDGVHINGDGYNKLLATGKPFALTEQGPHTTTGEYDNVRTIEAIADRYQRACWFLRWKDYADNRLAIVSCRRARELMTHDRVLNCGDFS